MAKEVEMRRRMISQRSKRLIVFKDLSEILFVGTLSKWLCPAAEYHFRSQTINLATAPMTAATPAISVHLRAVICTAPLLVEVSVVPFEELAARTPPDTVAGVVELVVNFAAVA